MKTALHLLIALVGLPLILLWTAWCAHRLIGGIHRGWADRRRPNRLIQAWTSTPYRNRYTSATFHHRPPSPPGPGLLGQRFADENINVHRWVFDEGEVLHTSIMATPAWLATITAWSATWLVGMAVLIGALSGAGQLVDHQASFLRTCHDPSGFTWQVPRTSPCRP